MHQKRVHFLFSLFSCILIWLSFAPTYGAKADSIVYAPDANYTITGQVTSRNWPYWGVMGVTVSTDSGQTAITDSSGNYTLSSVPSGSRTVTATKSDWFAVSSSASESKTVSLTGNTTVNFNQFSCKATASATISLDKTSVSPGESFNVTVSLKNTNYSVSAVKAYLDVSFDNSKFTIGTPTGSGWNSISTYPPGTTVWGVTSSGQPTSMTATKYLVSGERSGTYYNNTTNSFTVPITVKSTASTGTVTFYYRGTIEDKRNPTSTGSGTRDQQGWNVYTTNVTIVPPFAVSSATARINNSTGPVNITTLDSISRSGTIGGTGSGTVTYHWEYKSTSTSAWTASSNQTTTMTNGSASVPSSSASNPGTGSYDYKIVVTSPSSVTSNLVRVNITTPPPVTVTGIVKSRKWPYFGVSGVTITTDTGQTTTSLSDGTYTLANVPVGSRTFTASRTDWYATGTSGSASQTRTITAATNDVNFTDFTTKGSAQATISVDKTTVSPGETFNVVVTLKNMNFALNSGAAFLDLSFNGDKVTIGTITSNGYWTSAVTTYPPGSSNVWGVTSAGVGYNLSPSQVVDYLISAQRQGLIHFNNAYSFTVPLTVKSTATPGTITLKYRATVEDSRDPASSGSGTLDQQGWNVYTTNVTIVPPFAVSSATARINNSTGPVNITTLDSISRSGTISGTGSGTVTYHWEYKSTSTSTWTADSNQTTTMTNGSASVPSSSSPNPGAGIYDYKIVVTSPSSVTSNLVRVNITTPPPVTVTGIVKSRKWPYFGVSGVTITTDTGQTTTSLSDGTYTLANVPVGSRTFTASRTDWYATGTSGSASQTRTITAATNDVNFTDFTTKGSAQATISVDKTTVSPGETFNVVVTLKNMNFALNSGAAFLDLSFNGDKVTIGTITSNGYWTSAVTTYPPGSSNVWGVTSAGVGYNLSPSQVVDYLISAQRQGLIHFNNAYSFTVPLTVKSTATPGTITLKYRATVEDSRDPVSSGSGTLDQQGWNVYTTSVQVGVQHSVTSASALVNGSAGPVQVPNGSTLNLSGSLSGTGSGAVTYHWEWKASSSSTWQSMPDRTANLSNGSVVLTPFNTSSPGVGSWDFRIVVTYPSAINSNVVQVIVPQSVILPVPYFNQGMNGWCAPTSFAMILKYYGKSATPWDVATYWGLGPAEGPLTRQMAAKIQSYLTNHSDTQDLTLFDYGVGGILNFDNYKTSLDNGVPLFLGASTQNGYLETNNDGHASVIVGYSVEGSNKYLYINDPSGYWTKTQWGSTETAFVKVNWNDFYNTFNSWENILFDMDLYAILAPYSANYPLASIGVRNTDSLISIGGNPIPGLISQEDGVYNKGYELRLGNQFSAYTSLTNLQNGLSSLGYEVHNRVEANRTDDIKIQAYIASNVSYPLDLQVNLEIKNSTDQTVYQSVLQFPAFKSRIYDPAQQSLENLSFTVPASQISNWPVGTYKVFLGLWKLNPNYQIDNPYMVIGPFEIRLATYDSYVTESPVYTGVTLGGYTGTQNIISDYYSYLYDYGNGSWGWRFYADARLNIYPSYDKGVGDTGTTSLEFRVQTTDLAGNVISAWSPWQSTDLDLDGTFGDASDNGGSNAYVDSGILTSALPQDLLFQVQWRLGGSNTTTSKVVTKISTNAVNLVINEVSADSSAMNWVEIYNPSSQPVRLTAYHLYFYNRLNDDDFLDYDYAFPDFTLNANSYVVIHNGTGTNSQTDLYFGEMSILWYFDNADGAVALIGTLGGIDFVKWGSSSILPPRGTNWLGTNPSVPTTGLTLGRSSTSLDTDYGSDWTSQNPTPGGQNNYSPNPVPTLSNLNPSSATAGGAAFTLTVNGTNFVNGSVVRWNGSNRTTTYVSATQLTAAITAADIATAGTVPVTVFNPTPGGGTSNAVNFTINTSNPVPTLSNLNPSSAT
ncbi:MAG: C39 family peptidase, partial [Chloroflexota bacterium]